MGHSYTDKAPGLSLFALPHVAASGVVHGDAPWAGTWRRWLVRATVTGYAPVTRPCPRQSRRRAPRRHRRRRCGCRLTRNAARTSVGRALRACRRRTPRPGDVPIRLEPTLPGPPGSSAVLHPGEYQATIAVAAVGAYILLRERRGLLQYAFGIAPSLCLLAVYDTFAFGSPLHLSYRYVANDYTAQQQAGFFGIGIPSFTDLHSVLFGGSGFVPGAGLLALSPVLIPAALGLFLLWRQGNRLEASVCAFVGAASSSGTPGTSRHMADNRRATLRRDRTRVSPHRISACICALDTSDRLRGHMSSHFQCSTRSGGGPTTA